MKENKETLKKKKKKKTIYKKKKKKTQPERTSHSNTLTDIFFNVNDLDMLLGNLTATISDHLPQFVIIPIIIGKISGNKADIYERDWSKFD